MTDDLDVVPAEVRERALRGLLLIWDTALEAYPLDPLERLDLLELTLDEHYERCAAGLAQREPAALSRKDGNE